MIKLAPIAVHEPWCWSAAATARCFHLFALTAGVASLLISTHAVWNRLFPTWDGAGRQLTLPWATVLSFIQGICAGIVLMSWKIATSIQTSVL